jgi:hypothetical protein
MSAVQDLVDFYGKGGLEITTYSDVDDTAAKRSHLVRTVVQPDADIISWVHLGTVSEEVWEKHLGELQNKVRSIKRVRWLLKYAGFLFVIVPFTIYNAVTRELTHLIFSLIISILAAFLFRFVIALSLRLYIRRQLEKFGSALLER